MIPFLKQVANHYYPKEGVGDYCFIFPNRRSIAFFTKYFCELVAADSSVPMKLPSMYTIGDFFFKMSDAQIVDKVTLLLELYECYKELNPKYEPLDEFIFWGDVILSDFSDVDKYMADVRNLFQNVSEFKEMQDDFSYLTEAQREAIQQFIKHFTQGNGRVTVNLDSDDPTIKEKFLLIWDILYPLYESFNARLQEKGMAYDGMVYRHIATRLKEEAALDVLSEQFDGVNKFVFVGLNALSECEKVVMKKMRDAGLAEYCWDFSTDMIKDPDNKSSFFMSENVGMFPSSFKMDTEGLEVPEFNIISVPSSVGQVKQIPKIIKDVKDHSDCAIVLPDETLLVPLLNTIPPEVADVNVTMGYPMTCSSFYSLMNSVASLQLHLRNRPSGWFYHNVQVQSIFSSGIFRGSISEEGENLVQSVTAGTKFYIPSEDLKGDVVFEKVFRPIVTDMKTPSREQIRNLCDYLLDLTSTFAVSMSRNPDQQMELDFARRYYLDVQRLRNASLEVLPATFFRLLGQISAAESVPFEGEPLKGLQVMGPLETRALDFSTIVILSMNEGMFPRRSVSSSFIPAELRRGFGLPTYEYQDAVWAYYFYRMISRAKTVWMLYDSRTEGLKSGEESRYIKQLQYHFGIRFNRYYAQSKAVAHEILKEIPKTEEDIKVIRNANFSASSLKNYLDCPAKFYYHTVKKLKVDDEATEDLDSGMIGNIYHATMQALYLGPEAMDPSFAMTKDSVKTIRGLEEISAEYIQSWIDNAEGIRARIHTLIMSELKTISVEGRNLVTEEVLLSYVLKTLEKELKHMKDLGVDRFRVLGLEKTFNWEFEGFKFFGFIDRLDSFADSMVRVVDYKTGKVEDKDVNISDENAQKIVDALFGDSNRNRPKIAFQMFVYDMMVAATGKYDSCRMFNTIYPPAGLYKNDIDDINVSHVFNSLVKEKLKALFAEMTNPEVGFKRTEQVDDTCKWCDFKMICGR